MRIDAYNQIAHMYGAKSKSKTYTVARSNDGSDQVFISSLGRDIKVDPSDFASKLLEKYKATC